MKKKVAFANDFLQFINYLKQASEFTPGRQAIQIETQAVCFHTTFQTLTSCTALYKILNDSPLRPLHSHTPLTQSPPTLQFYYVPLIFFCSNSICFSVHLPLHDHRAKPEPAMLLFLIYLFTIKESTKEYRLVTTYHLHHYHRGPPMTRLVTTVYSIPPP